jgi:hypothetical protein
MEPIPFPPNPFIVDGAPAIPSFEQWFFLPGDWMLYWLASRAPALAATLGIGPGDYGGTLAGLIAWTSWIAFAIALIAATSAVRRLDRAVTGGFVGLAAELRRRVRMAIVLARYRRAQRGAPRQEPDVLLGEEPSLNAYELRVLDLHARLMPGFALSISDVAADLATRSYEARGALERLRQLGLLQSTVGGLDGETAYTLTTTGRALLRMRHTRPSTA